MSEQLKQLNANSDSLRYPYMIAEIGINHNGQFSIARDMILMADEAGFDAVKLQKRTINRVYTEEYLSQPRESFAGTTNRDLKQTLELSWDEHKDLAAIAHGRGMDYGLSVWDTESAEAACEAPFLDFVKIPSPRVMHHGIRRMVILKRNRRKPIFLSDGMSTMDEMRSALLDLTSMGVYPILMHCTSGYPTAVEHENLSNIFEDYGYPVQAHGYSTHSLRVEPILAATALGAAAIEMHVTLSHDMPGSDQELSWRFEDAAYVISQVRIAALSVGKPVVKQVKTCEKSAREKLWRTEDVPR